MDDQKDPPKRRILRASEIGQYSYCAQAWWRSSVLGISSSNIEALARGEAHHQVHGRGVQLAGLLRWAALALAILAIVVFLLS